MKDVGPYLQYMEPNDHTKYVLIFLVKIWKMFIDNLSIHIRNYSKLEPIKCSK